MCGPFNILMHAKLGVQTWIIYCLAWELTFFFRLQLLVWMQVWNPFSSTQSSVLFIFKCCYPTIIHGESSSIIYGNHDWIESTWYSFTIGLPMNAPKRWQGNLYGHQLIFHNSILWVVISVLYLIFVSILENAFNGVFVRNYFHFGCFVFFVFMYVFWRFASWGTSIMLL